MVLSLSGSLKMCFCLMGSITTKTWRLSLLSYQILKIIFLTALNHPAWVVCAHHPRQNFKDAAAQMRSLMASYTYLGAMVDDSNFYFGQHDTHRNWQWQRQRETINLESLCWFLSVLVCRCNVLSYQSANSLNVACQCKQRQYLCCQRNSIINYRHKTLIIIVRLLGTTTSEILCHSLEPPVQKKNN